MISLEDSAAASFDVELLTLSTCNGFMLISYVIRDGNLDLGLILANVLFLAILLSFYIFILLSFDTF